MHRLLAGMRHRPYFFVTLGLTAVLFLLLHICTDWYWSSQLLFSWNVAVWVYLLLTMKKLWRIPHQHILQQAQQQDASKWIILALVVVSIVMCMVAIVVGLSNLPNIPAVKAGRLTLSVLTIMSAWLFIHTVFAIHYAHDYYLAQADGHDAGLDFPKTTEPTYPDFIYFSYVIGTSAQTADVSITSRPMRVLNLLHIVLAYGFNTTILAICINVAASLIMP